jgi:glycolate oxidase
MISSDAVSQIDKLLGQRGYLDRPEDLTLYEYDGSIDKARPELVVFPQSSEQVMALVQIAREHRIPIVGRGAGTGLSGGVIARAGGIVISFARMNRIVEIDLANERAVLEPGVVNLEITQAVEHDGYFYAPDPSSQKACTIGGNVSENAGGPHTLAYGVTTNHVLGIETVLPDGTQMTVGGKALDAPGYDLTGLLTGSEGTMALVTNITVRLMRQPELVKTILAIYDTVDDCADSVAEITARAITPAAVEMLDGVMLRMVEEATHAGYPMDAAAVLLIELEGLKEAVEEQVQQIEGACTCCHAREVRIARSAAERELLWKGRKNAFGAVGRVSPAYYVQDGVVPRTKIAPTLREIHRISKKYGLTISNIFHAGDGNMHPIILFNHHKPGELERAKAAGDEILRFCIQQGGSITGEHGVGMEKMELIGEQFSGETLDTIARFKKLFDPE